MKPVSWHLKTISIVALVCFTSTERAHAVAGFSRSYLGPMLVKKLVEVARHGLDDHFSVEKGLAIDMGSPLVNVTPNGITADGDVLPMHKGKYWNMLFQWQFGKVPGDRPSSGEISGKIEFFEVEEYACIKGKSIRRVFDDRPPTLTNESQSLYQYDFQDVYNRNMKLLFSGTPDGGGCIQYLAVERDDPSR